MQASETRLSNLIIEKNVDGLIIVNSEGVVRFANPAAEALFGKKGEKLLGELFGSPLVAGETTEIDIIRRNGESVVAEMRVVELEWEGHTAHLASIRDITELVRHREELRSMSLVDNLTGAYNRRGFFRLAKQQVEMADRTKKKMSLIYADLDHLKMINDTFGHDEGDRALIEIADILKKTFRKSDINARIGGDEFVVLAIEAPGETAGIPAVRLEENLRKRNAKETSGHENKLSLSIGIAQYDPECPCSLDELLALADKSMYERKLGKQKC